MSILWRFFWLRRGRTDLLGRIEYKLYKRNRSYQRFYNDGRGWRV